MEVDHLAQIVVGICGLHSVEAMMAVVVPRDGPR